MYSSLIDVDQSIAQRCYVGAGAGSLLSLSVKTGRQLPGPRPKESETLAPGECRMGSEFWVLPDNRPGHRLAGAHTFVVEVPVKATRNLGLQSFHFSGIA